MSEEDELPPNMMSGRKGRPTLNEGEALRLVHEFVETGCIITGQSVHKFCSNAQFEFFVGGHGGRRRVRTLAGASLERTYYRARSFLKQHIDDHARVLASFARHGATADFLTDMCALESYWKAKLQENLAFARGDLQHNFA